MKKNRAGEGEGRNVGVYLGGHASRRVFNGGNFSSFSFKSHHQFTHTPPSKTMAPPLHHRLLLLFSLLPLSLSVNQEGLFLYQLKSILDDPNAALSTWNDRDSDPCHWDRITCDTSHSVTAVDLSNANLYGPFPAVLCRLTNLTTISFFNNNLNSYLPSEISSCQNLQSLNLAANYFSGEIPSSVAALPNLRLLDLTANSFSGEIPASFGTFQKLETLALYNNYLNGTIPEALGNISTLKNLLIGYNLYSPSQIPSHLGNLTSVEELWLASCNFVGSIPESIFGLTRLLNLDLSTNGLTGSIPDSITRLKSVVQIELFSNSFSGELRVGLSNLTNLLRFDVSANNLRGKIPADLCELPLGSLNLHENQFEGKVPDNISLSPNLYEFKCYSNRLHGMLPINLGLNSPLQTLDVSSNQFSSEIPPNLCAKGALIDLLMIKNSFSGNIPASLGKCQSLSRVRLNSNLLSGEVPVEFWGLPHMYLLDLVNNSLTGVIASTTSGANNLSTLTVSMNRFNGSIPQEIGTLSNLIEFFGSENNFSGTIPESLVNLSQLNRLVLDHNELSGNLPKGIQSWHKLFELNISHNRLSGEIPFEIGNLSALKYLDLSWNSFSGKIPISLQNLKLSMLNFSYNELSGDIPADYGTQGYIDSFLGNVGLCPDIAGLCPVRREAKSNKNSWILILTSILAGVVLIVGVTWFCWRYRNFKKAKKGLALLKSKSLRKFVFTEIEILSKWKSFHKFGFSELEIVDCLKEDNVIGSGSSGKVFKVVLSSGVVVAVKKIKGSCLGTEKDGFEAEVEMLGKIKHKSIVRLFWSYNTSDCKLLVYEYMLNGSLGDVLHSSKGGLLDWPKRYKIALDAAEGLSYLHHDCVPPIIHRDIKSNNILLDGEFGARVADFGIAKAVDKVSNGAETMTMIAGSCGYIAPEYAYTLRVNERSDIYSFGVVVLELVTGKRPNDPELGGKELVTWVCTTLGQSGIDQVTDPKLDCSDFKDEICRVLDIGLLCTNPRAINRPAMRKVVTMLLEARRGEHPVG